MIHWKDPENALTKLHPRVAGEDGDDIPAEGGSFFNYFEIADDPFDVSVVICSCAYPHTFRSLAQRFPMRFSPRPLITSWVTWLVTNLILRKRTVTMTTMTLRKLIWRNQGQKRRRTNDAATTFLFDNTYLSKPEMIFLSAVQKFVSYWLILLVDVVTITIMIHCVPFGLIRIEWSLSL